MVQLAAQTLERSGDMQLVVKAAVAQPVCIAAAACLECQ
jgi:hypothetical protein